MDWHAHEMVFGYTGAVIAGFLLTAVRNWTNQETLQGKGLVLLALLWILPRGLLSVPWNIPIVAIALLDIGFMVFLILAITRPIVNTQQWKHMGIVSKVVFLLLSNALFYMGVITLDANLIDIGLYSALYMVIALILVMARRLIPFFVKSALNIDVRNRVWLDRCSLVLFLCFWLAVVFVPHNAAASWLAGCLCVLHALRLWDWWAVAIWRRPILAVLYLAYATIVFGFAMKALEGVLPLSPFLATHAFAYGGIGIMTIGMMARVAWGHTGRDLRRMPAMLLPCFGLMLAGGLLRVVLPVLWPSYAVNWVVLSGGAWLVAFALFAWVYIPVLLKPRVDAV